MTELKGAIIGCGAIGREHLAALANSGVGRIAAICDLSSVRAEVTAQRFNVPEFYVDFEKMLADTAPHLVHITTPPASHFPIAKKCLERGFNVLCEKPIALDYRQFSELRDIAIAHSALLIENQNYRFHSAVRKIKELIESGDLGEVIDLHISVFVDMFSQDSPYIDPNLPHFATALSTGVVGDFLPHIAYLIRLFAGHTTDVRVEAEKRIPSSAFEIDEYRAFIKSERATAYVSFSGRVQPPGFWLKVIGTKIQAEANLFESPRIVLRRFRSGERALMTLVDGLGESRDVLQSAIRGMSRKLSGKTGYDGLQEFIVQTYGHLANRSSPPVNLQELNECALLVDRLSNVDSRL